MFNFESAPTKERSPEDCLQVLNKELTGEEIKSEKLDELTQNLLNLKECLLRPDCQNRPRYLKEILKLLDKNKEVRGNFTFLLHLILTLKAVITEYGDKNLKSEILPAIKEFRYHPRSNTRYWAHFTAQELERLE